MRKQRTVLVLLAFALALGTAARASGTSATFSNRAIAGAGFDVLDQRAPDLGGRYAVYESRSLILGGNYKLYVYDRVTGETTAVVTSSGNQTNADVWNGLVVYEDDSAGTKDVRLHDLRSGTNEPIANGAGEQTDPAIGDNVVVWHSGTDVYFRDLREAVNHKVPTGRGSQGPLGTSRGHVYYQDDEATGFDVYRYRHSWVETRCLSGGLDGLGNYAGDLAVHDDTVLWQANRFEWPNRAIMTYDVRSGVEATAATNSFDRQHPDVFGQAYTLADDAGPALGVRAKIEGWSSGSVLTTTTVMDHPSIYANSVAYTGDSDVWLGEHPTTAKRVAGANRYATAAAMSARHFTESTTVVLASGENWPDALSAAGLAGAQDCPLLLVRKDSVPPETAQEIVRLGATRFLLVGGTAAVSDAVFGTFQDEYGTYAIWRIAGANRYDTARYVSQWVYDTCTDGPTNPTWFGAAIVVSGENYADALSAAPLSAARHMPILLARQGELPPETAAELSQTYYQSALFVGGPGAVSEDVQEAAELCFMGHPGAYESGRWWGATRYETAAFVADVSVRLHLLDLDAIGLATGTGYADALGAGAALGSYGSPVILTAPASLSTASGAFLDNWTYDVGELQVIGGEAAVSASAMTDAANRLSP